MTGDVGGDLGGSIGFKSGSLRMGILAESGFSASLSSDQAMVLTADSEPDITISGYTSHPIEMQAEGASEPVSDLFATVGVFSSPTEVFWGTIWSGGAFSEDPLIDNYQHSRSAVKYVRLDDIDLTYDGNGKLTTVTKEEGDTKTLVYAGDLLIQVIDSYHGIIKDLSYDVNNQLTGVTVSKIV